MLILKAEFPLLLLVRAVLLCPCRSWYLGQPVQLAAGLSHRLPENVLLPNPVLLMLLEPKTYRSTPEAPAPL